MATTIITFKALSNHRIIRKNIPIEHNFEVIPPTMFNGVELPATSIESQVIDYLDEIDKTDLMIKYEFDIILDYWPKKAKKKKNEIKEFIDYCNPYIQQFPELEKPFRAVISESKDVLFGKRKSNETKFKEVLNMLNIAYKASAGTSQMICNRILKNKDGKDTGKAPDLCEDHGVRQNPRGRGGLLQE